MAKQQTPPAPKDQKKTETPEEKAARLAGAEAPAENDPAEDSAADKTEVPAEEKPAEENKPKAKAKAKGYQVVKGEEKLFVVAIQKGPKFNADTGAPIPGNVFNQKFTEPDFRVFEANAGTLGHKYEILHKPKGA